MSFRRKKKVSRLWRRPLQRSEMELRLERLGPNFRKNNEPPCACCGYDAEWIIRVETLDRMFCERCMVNALLDACNWNTVVPGMAPAA